jgi:hypothetical protein
MALAKARLHADTIDDPVITYFIDMAIGEVRAKSAPLQKNGRGRAAASNVVQLAT